MEYSNRKLETAESSKNIIDNAAGKMSIEVSPKNNNNKENSKVFDESMVCDDGNCIVNVDERKDENNQSITVELPPVAITERIPPKYYTMSPPNKSPKSKKRKFPIPTFDELLENLNSNILIMNFTKLLLFLQSNNKELCFPFIVKDYEVFFEMIVQDINILKSKSLDDNYRDISNRIVVAATSYLLTCVYEYRQAFQSIVMVIKKEYNNMMDQSENGTSSFSLSLVCEKVPKQKPSATAVNSNQIMNRKTDVLKTKASKPEALNSEAANKKATNTEAPKPEGSKPEASKTDAAEDSKSEAPKPEASKPKASKLDAPKPETPKPDASKTEVSEASKSKPWFPMPEIPKCIPHINQNPIRITKKMLKNRLKMENENLFIKRLPAKFISDTLNTIHEFLLDEERFRLVFMPKTHSEQDFYRKCLSWCRNTFVVSKFGEEFQEMHYQISCLLCRVNCTINKGSTSKINETTGIKEVTYIKARKNVPIVSIPDIVQSPPKKKKVNLQNVLQLAVTDNIKLASVVNLNQSLRNKKKNKKLKKAKKANDNAGASKEASGKSTNQAKTWTDGSSSTCSSRGTSKDRSKVTAQAKHAAKRVLNEINQTAKNACQETSRSRRAEDTTRKEQLIEALSVPVQSDKAMRMMRGMGWSGGALGARGNGITEPLMPSLDLAKGAGLGHSKNAKTEKIGKKLRESKTAPSFISENSNATTETDKTENDVIVQRTKQLLLENPTFDSIKKVIELQKPKKSNVELPTETKTKVELPKPIKTNVEPPEPRKSTAKQLLKQLPTLTKFSMELQKPDNSELKSPLPFRQEILHSILELLNSDATSKTLKYENKLCKKARKFARNAAKALKSKINYGIFQKEEHDICRQIQNKYHELPQVAFEALFSHDFKSVDLIKKVPSEFETSSQQKLPIITQLPLKGNTEIILEEKLHSYIMSSGTHFESEKAYEALKFKVLFLLNILSFVKSFNEEVEVTFNKALNVKQKTYILNVVDEVNMRIKFGSSPAEAKLCAEIKNHVKDAFLGSMFNHQYTVVTLSKYFRFKRLNRPDNAIKRTCQTTVNLDAFSSETFSEPRLNTN